MWPWRVKIPTQNLLILLLLLMLMMRIMLETVCYRFGSWGFFIRLNFCSDFEHKIWSRFWSWSSGKICSWSLANFLCWCFVKVMKLNFCRDSEARFEQVLWRGWCLVVILKLIQDLCLNLWYELNPRVRCAFGNVYNTKPLKVIGQADWGLIISLLAGDMIFLFILRFNESLFLLAY